MSSSRPEPFKAARRWASAGLVATALAVLLVPMILVPAEERSEYFWPRVLWTEFLAVLVWGLPAQLTNLVGDARRARSWAGIYPALCIVVAGYASLSFVLLMANSYLGDRVFTNRVHLSAQVLVLVGSFVVCALLAYALPLANGNARAANERADPIAEICAMLHAEENRLADCSLSTDQDVVRDGLRGLKALREKLQYSLAGHVVRAPLIANAALLGDLRDLCGAVALVELRQRNSSEKLRALTHRADSLRQGLDVLAEQQKIG